MLVIKGITMGTTLTFNNTIILITTKLGVPKLKFYFHYLKEIWVYLSEPNAKLPTPRLGLLSLIKRHSWP